MTMFDARTNLSIQVVTRLEIFSIEYTKHCPAERLSLRGSKPWQTDMAYDPSRAGPKCMGFGEGSDGT